MIDGFLLIGLLISFLYLILMVLLIVGIKQLKSIPIKEYTVTNAFSVIIPFRNEAIRLPELLQSIKNLDYPTQQFEFIMVNDGSTDDSELLINMFIENNPSLKINVIQNTFTTQSPKKEAIENGINKALFEWIITTDADCMLPEKWLKSFDNCIQSTNCEMIVAPVIFTTDNSILQDFQQLDFLSLMGATQGGFGIGFPFLCNGANLCYNKTVFKKVNGFEGNKNIASGDDVFLMEKFLKRNRLRVIYLKSLDALVQTSAQKTVKGLVNQRIRWASKTRAVNNSTANIIGIIVLSMNLWLPLSLLFLNSKIWFTIPLFWLLKVGTDFILLRKVAQFYQVDFSKIKFLKFSFLYPFYFLFIGFLSLGKGFEWKGRQF